MWIAERAPVTIVSADSRQVYRGFDVGTAKPTAAERARVPHLGIDVADPTRALLGGGVGRRRPMVGSTTRARRADAARRGRNRVCICARCSTGLFEEPPLDPTRRAALAATLGRDVGRTSCGGGSQTLDPARAHLGRTQLAARDRDRAADRAPAERSASRARARPPLAAALSCGGSRVRRWRERIAARIDDMLDHGWPDEVRGLMQTVPADAPAWNATGYDAVRRLVRGETSRQAAHEEILIATRQYAKRQRTWFRHQLPADRVTRVDPTIAGLDARRRAMGRYRRLARRGRSREDRHHLLSDVRRLGRRRDRAGHRARAPRSRDPLHHVPAAVPASVVPPADLLPRSRRRPLSAVRVSAVRPGARRAHARGRARARARPAALPLRDSARDQRVDRQGDAAPDETPTSASSRRCTAPTSRSSGRIRRSGRSRSSRSRSRTGSRPCRAISSAKR